MFLYLLWLLPPWHIRLAMMLDLSQSQTWSARVGRAGIEVRVASGEVWILQGINALTIYPKVRHTVSRAFAPAS